MGKCNLKPCPCEKCPTRITYAVLFDIHISGEDCPYPCDKWGSTSRKERTMLIIDMPMPKCCDDCDANYDACACGISGKAWYRNERYPNFDPSKERMPDCPIKGEISEIEFMHLEEERAFAARNIAAERKDDEQIH